MKIARIPLQPFSHFHFGEFKIDIDLGLSSTSAFAHSDTLFSALVNSYCKIGDADNFIQAFADSKLNISSLFYYLKNKTENGQMVLFLPKPVFLENDSKTDGYHKKRNKIKFVSVTAWENGLHQEEWLDKSKYVILQDEFVMTKAELDGLITNVKNKNEIKLFRTVQVPKSPIRKTEDQSIFYQTNIVIADNGGEIETGFYFIYEAKDHATEIMLKDATNIMSKSGIGGERNNMGRIMGDPVFGEFEFSLKSSEYASISLISPNDLSEFRKIVYYKTITRGGRRLDRGGNYQAIRFIQEGAKIADKITGRLIGIGIDDGNNHAYRYGKAFLIPIP